jgi:hypothetical protein
LLEDRDGVTRALRRDEILSASGTLHLYALFHLNMCFSSIEEEQRGEVIRRCYWPLLDLAEAHGPIGIEASAFTLEEIAQRDPEWLGRAAALIARGRIELIGSGYAQIIGPLVPWRVTEANLRIGNEICRRLLQTTPKLALINEQAYSAGLVGLYRDAGFEAILMDWDNPGAQHPKWPFETRFRPQRARGTDGRTIGLLWTNTVAFQKLQRFVHGDIEIDDYLGYVREQRASKPRALCVYASDAEIFDFRPGRYRTEERISVREWKRVAAAFEKLGAEPGLKLASPSEVFAAMSDPTAEPLRLETASCPIPVKKQRKYNLSRWAVTGRDDLAINAACQRIHDRLAAEGADDAAWKELCYLWSSDFRTHITEKRWTGYCERLRAVESTLPLREGRKICEANFSGRGLPQAPETHPSPKNAAHFSTLPQGEGRLIADRFIEIGTPSLRATLDRRRGLSIARLQFAGDREPIVGSLPHGHFSDIALQADWYTGDCVFEAPGEHKVTDLEWCEAWLEESGDDIVVAAEIDTPFGKIEKRLRFEAARPRVQFELAFHWPDWGKGSLRLGHVTLLPWAFDWDQLRLTTHNGGKDLESFELANTAVDHGAPVSFLVSASHGLGMTEGWAEIGDKESRLRVAVDRAVAPLLGLLTHKRVGGSLFCQIQLSALELDDTRKPSAYYQGPRRFSFSLERVVAKH